MMKKTALITGVTGQDGAYLSELLLAKGYTVHGLKRRTSLFNTERIDHWIERAEDDGLPFHLHHGDMTDSSSLMRVIEQAQPDEIYNLAAQSHVAVSFEEPEYTANSDALGVLRLLEALRNLRMMDRTRFYQASTSELYGLVEQTPQNERTPFHPRSPYGVAKLYGHWITVNYREAYGLFACNGILFNHESPLRGETFVTRKITRGMARVAVGLQRDVALGNLDALRDWGHARDYVTAQWLMLQQDKADDYVIATGIQHSVRDFVERVADRLGMSIEWQGRGVDERGVLSSTTLDGLKSRIGSTVVRVHPRYFRPAEVQTLLGDASKARAQLGWQPTIGFDELVAEMVNGDLDRAQREVALDRRGLRSS